MAEKTSIDVWNKTNDVNAVAKALGAKNKSHIVQRLKYLHDKGKIDFSSYYAELKIEKKESSKVNENTHERSYEDTLKAREFIDDLARRQAGSFLKYINEQRQLRGLASL